MTPIMMSYWQQNIELSGWDKDIMTDRNVLGNHKSGLLLVKLFLLFWTIYFTKTVKNLNRYLLSLKLHLTINFCNLTFSIAKMMANTIWYCTKMYPILKDY